MRKRIAILGSTGSIGTQALQVIKNYPDEFCLEAITANNNADLLFEQARTFLPNAVVIGNENKYRYLSDALAKYPVKVYAGQEAIVQIVEMSSIDIVLTAMVGFVGLLPTIRAIESGRQIALANKETLVVAGRLISDLAYEKNCRILPVDSEHSAIFQCLTGEYGNPVEKIYLTASGGPFRDVPGKKMAAVTKEDALKHPNWNMGSKITIDSASLMNKGLEAIEAKWLFNLAPENIEVVVHPQSVIHSVVQFEDGSMKAQMGLPDMKLPIQYALSYPKRLKSAFPRFSFLDHPKLTFEPPDIKKFRNLALAFSAMKSGGNMPCILNAANEAVVDAFLNSRISFSGMSAVIEETMQRAKYLSDPRLEDLLETDREARIIAVKLINNRDI
ncbi:MAG: 1-deoxy-D-xylulose-5-phosphate reductoisomerase [Bacteroidetes bacterium]|nr:1-deoxy-D-xylulose-5-phosphate reductoisomerase [Bacteroidota bacterium]